MALYNHGYSPLERALQQGSSIDRSASEGYQSQTSQAKSKWDMGDLITGLGTINAMGEGNALTGAIGTAGGPNLANGAALGTKFGQKADNPWEAFIAGGVGANKEGMFNFGSPQSFIPQDPVSNFIGGGLAGIAGFLF